MAFMAKVPNRAVDVDSRALLACSILCFGLDYIFTRHHFKLYENGAGGGVLARFNPYSVRNCEQVVTGSGRKFVIKLIKNMIFDKIF